MKPLPAEGPHPRAQRWRRHGKPRAALPPRASAARARAPAGVFRGGPRQAPECGETSGNLLSSETSGGQHGFSQCTLTARTSREAALTASPAWRLCSDVGSGPVRQDSEGLGRRVRSHLCAWRGRRDGCCRLSPAMLRKSNQSINQSRDGEPHTHTTLGRCRCTPCTDTEVGAQRPHPLPRCVSECYTFSAPYTRYPPHVHTGTWGTLETFTPAE